MIGIRRKLFLQIGGLVILLVCLMFMANTLLLEPFYINRQKKQLLADFEKIDALDTLDVATHINQLVAIEAISRADLIITNQEGQILYTSNPHIKRTPPQEGFSSMTEKKPPPAQVTQVDVVSESVKIILATDDDLDVRNLVLVGSLSNGLFIELRIPIASIHASINLMNQFVLMTGLLLFLLSLVVAYVISITFTKPIRDMNASTMRLKQLDFKTHLEVTSNDELGQLAESINELSVVLSQTISRLNTQNQQLAHEIKEKTKLDNKRKELLNNVSHELKTPLALMHGYAEALQLNVVMDPDKIHLYADIIHEETQKMTAIIESLLHINHIESGDLRLDISAFDVTACLRDEINRVEPLLTSEQVALTTDLEKPTWVAADRVLIERVISNLLTNAIWHGRAPKSLHISLDQRADKTRVSFSNPTSPLTPLQLENLWESFYKVDDARKRAESGHGIGLSVVKAIMQAHKQGFGVDQVNDTITFWFECEGVS